MDHSILKLRRCASCGTTEYWDFLACRNCSGQDWDPLNASGRGTIYSFSEIHFAPTAPTDLETPFLLALVELAEGPHVMTHIQDSDEISIGDPVRLQFRSIGGSSLPIFVPST